MPLDKKSKGWKIYFVLLAVANAATIIFPFSVLIWLTYQARTGSSGTEYLAFALVPLLLAGAFVAILNVITIIIYIVRQKPARRAMILGVVVCLLSLGYLATLGISAYRAYLDYRSFQEPPAIRYYDQSQIR